MSLPQKRILLVDDDSDFSAAMGILLNMADFDVTQSNNVSEAAVIAETEPFDLFVFDSRIQAESGLELCRRIRTFDQSTPVLFCSGNAYETDRQKGLQAGAQAYLTKPVDFDELIQVVRHLMPLDSQ